LTGVLPIANGGTGLSTTPTNGQIDIGNGTGFTRTTLTAGTGIAITNAAGAITIAVDGSGEVTSFRTSLSGLTPSTATGGNVVLGGTLGAASGGTGATTLTGYVYGNGVGVMTAATTIPTTALSGTITNAQLANSSITINGNSVSLGGSTTVTASTTAALTMNNSGTGAVSGTTFDGGTARTISYNTIGASPLAGSSSLVTVGTITSGTWNGSTIDVGHGGTGATTLTGYLVGNGATAFTAVATIPNSGLTNSSVTYNGQTVALGGSGTITANTTNALTIGTGLSGTSFNGSAPVTIALSNTGVTANTYGSSAVIPVITVNAQGQITSISTQATNAPAYQGTWNANTNVPALTSSVGTSGYYYVVTTAGNTTLNGVSGWNIGDWAIFSNGAWQKVPGSSTESFTTLITTNLQVGGLTGYMYANNTTGNVTASTTIPNAGLANSAITINGISTSLGGSISVGTVTSVAALTLGTTGTDLSSSVATGTTTPVITLNVPTASATNRGALSSTDWSTFNNKQNAFGSQTANYVYAAPNGSAGVPSFRALVAADIPALSGTYIPYTGASSAIDLNAQTVTNIAHLGLNSTAVPNILLRAYGDNTSNSRISIRGYSSNASSSSMRVAKYRGTFASPQAPLSGDSLGKFELAGYGTTSSDGYTQASYEGVATENWGATARGTKALFYVTPNTTITQTVALTINQDSTAVFANTVTANGVLLTGNTGTVTSVATSGTVNGLTLTGGTITTTGTITLGGTLDLSSPPAIGGTTPNTIKGTTGTFTTGIGGGTF